MFQSLDVIDQVAGASARSPASGWARVRPLEVSPLREITLDASVAAQGELSYENYPSGHCCIRNADALFGIAKGFIRDGAPDPKKSIADSLRQFSIVASSTRV